MNMNTFNIFNYDLVVSFSPLYFINSKKIFKVKLAKNSLFTLNNKSFSSSKGASNYKDPLAIPNGTFQYLHKIDYPKHLQ